MALPSSSPKLALHVVETLQRAGHIAYFAGGCVRDQIMLRTPKDYDVATSAHPRQVLALFPHSQKVGIHFGVVIVKERHAAVEVATFRADGDYHDGRRPDAVTFTTPEHDAQRRDFTCNGIFYDPVKDEFHDFVNGRADIAAGLLRAIGDPRQRFAEDHLRMLRAVRFAARLGFEMEASTHAAIAELQDQIQKISRERIGEEVRQILEHPTRVRGMELLRGFPRLFNNLFFVAPERLARPVDWLRLARLAEPVSRPLGSIAVLLDLWGNSKDLTTVCDKLRASLVFSNHESEAFTWWATHFAVIDKWPTLTVAQCKRMMASPFWPDLARLYVAGPMDEPTRQSFRAKTAALAAQGVAPVPFITGEDLIGLGARPGREFKKWLSDLYDQQLEGTLATPAAAWAAAEALIKSG